MSTHNSQTDLWQSSKVQKLQNRHSYTMLKVEPKVYTIQKCITKYVDLLRIYSKTCTVNTGYVYVYVYILYTNSKTTNINTHTNCILKTPKLYYPRKK